MKGEVYPDRNSLHKNMGPPDSCVIPSSAAGIFREIGRNMRCGMCGPLTGYVTSFARIDDLGLRVILRCHGKRKVVDIDERLFLLRDYDGAMAQLRDPFPLPKLPRCLPPIRPPRSRGRPLPQQRTDRVTVWLAGPVLGQAG